MKYAVILFASIGLLFVSCSKAPIAREQTLRINICAEPTTLDPRKARNLNDITTCRMLFEGLTRISKSGEIELATAEAVEISEDRLEYVFHLKNAFWSDGTPVTSYDFAQNWKTILDPQFPTDIAYQLYVIQNGQKVKSGEVSSELLGVKTPDAKTLVVKLDQPIPYFLEVCSMGSFLPVPSKIALENPNWSLSPETFVGNGPFTLKSWIHTDEIVVQKSANYWDSQSVLLNQIELVMVSVDTEMQLFEENKLDWAGSPLSTLPIDAVPYLKQTKKLKVNPLSGTYFLRVNTDDSNASNPLQSASFRKAIAYSIDRDAIANHVLQGGQIGARSLVPPEMGLIEDGYFSEELSATELLQEAFEDLKQSQSTLEPITLMFVAGDRNMSIAQAVQKQIETTLNIVVQLQAVEGKVFNQRIKQKKFQLATGSWIADFNDPINFLEVFKHKNGSTNNTNWENPKYIDLLNQSVICGDQDERKQILRKAEEILMDQMPIIPIYHFALNFMQKEGVEGIALSPIGQVDFRWAHIDEAKHSR